MLTENNNQYRKWIDISINITTTYRWSHEGDISQLCYIQSSDWIKINLPYLSSDVFSWDVIYSFQILQFGLSTRFQVLAFWAASPRTRSNCAYLKSSPALVVGFEILHKYDWVPPESYLEKSEANGRLRFSRWRFLKIVTIYA
jgi:hypothetical protein